MKGLRSSDWNLRHLNFVAAVIQWYAEFKARERKFEKSNLANNLCCGKNYSRNFLNVHVELLRNHKLFEWEEIFIAFWDEDNGQNYGDFY